MHENTKVTVTRNQDHTYNNAEGALDRWNRLFTSRIGDGTGDTEEQYLSVVKLVAACKGNARWLDIGCGFGRIIKLIQNSVDSIVGLEPDCERFNACHNDLSDGERIRIINSTLAEYKNANPDDRFDVIIVSMLTQHVATWLCDQILQDVHGLLKPDGVAIIATTQQDVERFTCQSDPTPQNEEEFNRYAIDPASQNRGIAVRHFSKASFVQAIERADLRIRDWGQFTYVRPENLQSLADLMKVPAEAIRDVAVSQYAVVKKKGTMDESATKDSLRKQEELVRLQRFNIHNSNPQNLGTPKAPLLLRIEVVNQCNANCIFCTYKYQKRPIKTMSFDIFKRAVDQFTALGGTFVSFTPIVGDSLIDRGLEDKVAYVRKFPQYDQLELWTNGILLTRSRFEALVDAGINQINISMSGFSADEYSQLLGNNNYAKVIKNLTEIAQSNALKKVKFVVMARTGSSAPEQEPDYIQIRQLGAFPIVFQKAMFSWHGQIKEEDLPGNMFLISGPRDQTKPCFQLWTGFTLMSDGEMTVCGCTDIDGAGLPLGNIQDVALDAHLRDGRWLKLRDSFIEGTPPEFCKGCDMYWPHG